MLSLWGSEKRVACKCEASSGFRQKRLFSSHPPFSVASHVSAHAHIFCCPLMCLLVPPALNVVYKNLETWVHVWEYQRDQLPSRPVIICAAQMFMLWSDSWSHRLVRERWQNYGFLHGVHHQLPQLLQHPLQHGLLTDLSKESQAGGKHNRSVRGFYSSSGPQRFLRPQTVMTSHKGSTNRSWNL